MSSLGSLSRQELERTTVPRYAWYLLGLLILSIPWSKLEVLQRITLTEVLFVVFALVTIFELLRSKRPLELLRARVPRNLAVVAAGWVVAVGLSGIQAPHKLAFLFEWCGVVYVAVLAITLTSLFSGVEDERAWRLTFGSMSVVAVVGVVGLVIAAGTGSFPRFLFSPSQKLIATFERSGQLAGFAVLGIPLSWGLLMSSRGWRAVAYAALALGLVCCLVGSASRAGFAAILVWAVAYTVWAIVRCKYRALIAMVSLVVVGALALYLLDVLQVAYGERLLWTFETVLSDGQFTDEWRLANWGNALSVFTNSPILGYGLGSIVRDFAHEVHSTYLSILGETGLVGAAGFIVLFGYIGFLAFQNVRLAVRKGLDRFEPYAVGLLGGLAAFAVFGTQHIVYRSRHLWLAIALVVSLNGLLRRVSAASTDKQQGAD